MSFRRTLIVVGSGVTGAEFAAAYQALGSQVTLVSSRDRVLPGEDADAAAVVEAVFRRRGMTVMNNARAASVTRTAGGVAVELVDGTTVEGTHCLMAVGSIPNTADARARGGGRARRRPPDTSRSTGCRARRLPASTRPATAPEC